LKFTINPYFYDEILLDIVPLDVCGIVLGIPYLYDRDAIFLCKNNEYQLEKDGKLYIIRYDKSRNHVIVSRQVKRLFNASRNLTLVVMKEKA